MGLFDDNNLSMIDIEKIVKIKYKFKYSNIIDILNLHDCVIEDVKVLGEVLLLRLDGIDVMPSYPYNVNPTAKVTSEAVLVFKGCEITESGYYDLTNMISEQDAKVISVDIFILAEKFEILKVEKTDCDGKLCYDFFGVTTVNKGGFAHFTIRFDSVDICWNEFIGDSWFVKREKQED